MDFSTTSNISLKFGNDIEIKPLYVEDRIVIYANRFQGGDDSSYMIQTVTLDVNKDNLDAMRQLATEILYAVNQISERLELGEE